MALSLRFWLKSFKPQKVQAISDGQLIYDLEMLSSRQLNFSGNSPKVFSFALSALITFGPLFYFANHSLKLDSKKTNSTVVEIRLIENLIELKALPRLAQTQLASKPAAFSSPVMETIQGEKNNNSIAQPPPASSPQTSTAPSTLNLNIGSKPQDTTYKSPVRQLLEDESAKAAKKQNEKFATDVQKAVKPDCLKNDHGLGLLNIVPLIYDIAKDKCN